MAFINQLFQYDNFDSPILKYIDDSMFINLEHTKQKNANFFIQESYVKLQDDILLGSRKTFPFP
jgi:hypothetical protein